MIALPKGMLGGEGDWKGPWRRAWLLSDLAWEPPWVPTAGRKSAGVCWETLGIPEGALRACILERSRRD